MVTQPTNFDELLARLDQIENLEGMVALENARDLSVELLGLGETVLKFWAISRDEVPTTEKKEGFVILALHKQGAKGEPSFNACRETCREIVFQHNVIMQAVEPKVTLNALRLQIMVVRHLALFVSGKLEVAGLGEFCCASKSIRQKSDIQDSVALSGTV